MFKHLINRYKNINRNSTKNIKNSQISSNNNSFLGYT